MKIVIQGLSDDTYDILDHLCVGLGGCVELGDIQDDEEGGIWVRVNDGMTWAKNAIIGFCRYRKLTYIVK